MGMVGLNGDVTYQSTVVGTGKANSTTTISKGCLLYMTVDNKIPSYTSSYCQFPVIGAGVITTFAVLFLGYWAAVVHRFDDFMPVITSQTFMGIGAVMAIIAFSICGEIGIGLNIACKTTSSGQSLTQCLAISNFQALYTAQVCAGLMGGIWVTTLVLEYIQLKKRPDFDSDPYLEGQHYQEQQSSSDYATTMMSPNMSQV
ncbi:hypothetical protein EDD11_009540 [Mortierella claussenii]|nr:hypothetical protein EDD11_009540 [Mortierella claussenii]